jgi:hypothetical protein
MIEIEKQLQSKGINVKVQFDLECGEKLQRIGHFYDLIKKVTVGMF